MNIEIIDAEDRPKYVPKPPDVFIMHNYRSGGRAIPLLCIDPAYFTGSQHENKLVYWVNPSNGEIGDYLPSLPFTQLTLAESNDPVCVRPVTK